MAEHYRLITDMEEYSDPYQALANEIIRSAAEDYVEVLQYLHDHEKAPDKRDYLNAEQLDTLRVGTGITFAEKRRIAKTRREFRAEEDWIVAQRVAWRQELADRVRHTPEWMRYNRDIRRHNKVLREKAELEAFFRCDMYKLMTRVDGEWLIEALKAQANGNLGHVYSHVRREEQ